MRLPRLLRWLLVLAMGATLAACGQVTTNSATSSIAPTARPTPRATAMPASESGLEQVAVGDLPPEVAVTLELIAQGGPFPYDRDGIPFQNRERLLPRKPQRYYHEYTVTTPGEDDRGARRLITGEQGEVYYTADHYLSFAEVVP